MKAIQAHLYSSTFMILLGLEIAFSNPTYQSLLTTLRGHRKGFKGFSSIESSHQANIPTLL